MYLKGCLGISLVLKGKQSGDLQGNNPKVKSANS